MQRNSRLVYSVLLFLILGSWFLAKYRLLTGLSYTSDLFGLVQSSNSYLRGRPLLSNNDFGAAGFSHNFFLLTLLGPFTYLYGAFGLLVPHFLLLTSGALLLIKRMACWPSLCFSTAILIISLFFGPISFWIWDDPIYGWHAELLYFPLIVLFVLTYQLGSRFFYFFAMLIFLNHEGGAIVAGATHMILTWDLMRQKGVSFATTVFKTGVCGAFWAALFLFSIYLHFKVAHSYAHLRMTGAFGNLHMVLYDQEVRQTVITMFLDQIRLLAAVILPLSVIKPSYALLALFFVLPVLAVNLTGSMAYIGRENMLIHGLSWPARFGSVWGVFCATLLCALERKHLFEIPKRLYKNIFWICITLITIYLQLDALKRVRNYDFTDRMTVLYSADSPHIYANRITESERHFLDCLKLISAKSTVALHPSLFGAFHRADFLHVSHISKTELSPEIVICETANRLPFEGGCNAYLQQRVQAGWVYEAVEGVAVASEKRWSEQINTCVSSAGRKN